MTKIPLPIDAIIPHIQEYLIHNETLILQATPGAGKTTRIPPCLLSVTKKKIIVLEPRRLAARLSAMRIAQEIGEECGDLVGYQVRFEKKESAKTRIKFITEGLFLRLLLNDPKLEDIGCVVLDEFHERHIHSDVALMIVKHLQKTTRPDLKLVVMSATLETKSLNDYLPNAKVFVCETKNYPVTVEYISNDSVGKSLEILVRNAVEKTLKNKEDKGHILVFLPGRQEILRCAQQLEEFQNQFSCKLFQLTADTNCEEQEALFSNWEKRKIILSTNVAETSITIDGVTTVIDSGLAKILGHAAWSGFPTLELKPIAKSSCIQRSGRAGRTQSGHTIRLFTQYDYNLRPQFETPEIQRVDLTQSLLELKNAFNLHVYPWFESPLQNAIDSCTKLLQYLGAIDENKNLTKRGQEMVSYPFHPRVSRILIEGKNRNLFPQTLMVVCLLNEGSILKRNIELNEFSHSDIDFQLSILRKNIKNYVDVNQVNKVKKLLKNLCVNYKIHYETCFSNLSNNDLSCILLTGFLDRVCKLRINEESVKKKGLPEYNLCLGGGAILSRLSTVVEEEFILALVAEESLSKTQSHSTQIQIAHGINKSLLLDLDNEFISEKEEFYWNYERQTACCAKRIYYGKIVLKEEQIYTKKLELENILLEELKKYWPLPFENDQDLRYLNTRLDILKQYDHSIGIEPIDGENFELFLSSICEGKKSFSEILEKKLQEYIDNYIGFENTKKLNYCLPVSIVVGKGRKIQVHYELHKPPFICSRLQDFFGTLNTPRVLNNKLPLVVHLLAPNMQSVQVTTDLAGFWERGYQEVRKELSRKYPRHSWPEDPKNAEPPDLVKKRR